MMLIFSRTSEKKEYPQQAVLNATGKSSYTLFPIGSTCADSYVYIGIDLHSGLIYIQTKDIKKIKALIENLHQEGYDLSESCGKSLMDRMAIETFKSLPTSPATRSMIANAAIYDVLYMIDPEEEISDNKIDLPGSPKEGHLKRRLAVVKKKTDDKKPSVRKGKTNGTGTTSR